MVGPSGLRFLRAVHPDRWRFRKSPRRDAFRHVAALPSWPAVGSPRRQKLPSRCRDATTVLKLAVGIRRFALRPFSYESYGDFAKGLAFSRGSVLHSGALRTGG